MRDRQVPIGGEEQCQRRANHQPTGRTHSQPSVKLKSVVPRWKNNQLSGSWRGQAEEPSGHILIFLSEGDPMEILNHPISWWKISNFMPIYIYTDVMWNYEVCIASTSRGSPLNILCAVGFAWCLRLWSHSHGMTPFKHSSRHFQLSVTDLTILALIFNSATSHFVTFRTGGQMGCLRLLPCLPGPGV